MSMRQHTPQHIPFLENITSQVCFRQSAQSISPCLYYAGSVARFGSGRMRTVVKPNSQTDLVCAISGISGGSTSWNQSWGFCCTDRRVVFVLFNSRVRVINFLLPKLIRILYLFTSLNFAAISLVFVPACAVDHTDGESGK